MGTLVLESGKFEGLMTLLESISTALRRMRYCVALDESHLNYSKLSVRAIQLDSRQA